jgi:hypothetical protein
MIEPSDDGILLGEAEPFDARAAPREAAEKELLAALDGRPTSWPDWARSAGRDPSHTTVRRARDRLHEQQRVHKDEDGNWMVAS